MCFTLSSDNRDNSEQRRIIEPRTKKQGGHAAFQEWIHEAITEMRAFGSKTHIVRNNLTTKKRKVYQNKYSLEAINSRLSKSTT